MKEKKIEKMCLSQLGIGRKKVEWKARERRKFFGKKKRTK